MYSRLVKKTTVSFIKIFT